LHDVNIELPEVTMSTKYVMDRERLIAQIEEWNSNRLDLFALSQPNEVSRF
jgi:hypothetical protein